MNPPRSSEPRRHHLALVIVAVLAVLLSVAPTPARAQPSDPTAADPPIASGREAITELGRALGEVAGENGLTAAQLEAELRADETLHVDRNGELLYVDPLAPGEPAPPESQGAPTEAGPPTTDPVFFLHSRAGADHTIYLDFDGHTTSGTSWNSAYGIDPIVSPAYNISGTADTWSASEITRIRDIWNRVVEDYSPFDIDVTTEEPPVDKLRRTGGGDTQWGVRVVLTADTWALCGCGGHAYIGAFDDTTDEPAFVYNSSLAGAAEAASHEVGHTLLLAHDGTSSVSYYQGHGSGATSWAPLMGASYYTSVTQWSKGDYYDANNNTSSANYGNGADDLAVIADLTNGNGFGYRPDDHGNTIGSATTMAGPAVAASGVVETTNDVDVFAFTTGTGTVTINLTPWAGSANLDIDARLLNSAGTQIAASNPTNALNASFSQSLGAGTYYVTVDGTGTGSPLANPPSGYSHHASLGQYTLSGTIVPPPSGPITGTVNEDGTGDPVVGVWVSAVSTTTGAEIGTTTNGAGAYSLPVTTGTHRIRFVDPTGDHTGEYYDDVALAQGGTAPTVAAGASGVNASLAPGPATGRIHGTVTEDGTGDPLAGVFVAAVGPFPQAADITAATLTDGTGGYDFEGLVGGDFLMVFVDPDLDHAFEYADDTSQVNNATLTTTGPRSDATVDASLAPQTLPATGPAILDGTVTETGSGDPIAALVLAIGPSGIAAGTVADANGDYSFALPPGDYHVEFVDPAAAHRGEWHDDVPLSDLTQSTTVTLPSGGLTLDADLLPAGATGVISGAVTATGGGALPGVWVEVLDATTATVLRGATTDGAGTFSVAGLSTGSYLVRYLDPTGARATEYHDNVTSVGAATVVSVTAGTTASLTAALAPS